MSFLFTSESVSEGHPDKVCDAISDGILDSIFDKDPQARVACETFVTTVWRGRPGLEQGRPGHHPRPLHLHR